MVQKLVRFQGSNMRYILWSFRCYAYGTSNIHNLVPITYKYHLLMTQWYIYQF
jgi:hypothetical protein